MKRRRCRGVVGVPWVAAIASVICALVCTGGRFAVSGNRCSILGGPTGGRILVVLHGIMEDANDVRDLARVAGSGGNYDVVITPSYDWTEKTDAVVEQVFGAVTSKYPDATFDLIGYSRGGQVAIYAATQFSALNGKVNEVLTIDSPHEGMSALSQVVSVALAQTGIPNLDLLGTDGIAELNSSTELYRHLHEQMAHAANDVSSLKVVELYGDRDIIVTRDSALAESPGGVRSDNVRKFVATSMIDPESTGHREMRRWAASHGDLFGQMLRFDLPKEAAREPITVCGETITKRDKVPAGWIVCQCPEAHPSYGVVVDGVRYHAATFSCPDPSEPCLELQNFRR